jgi:signal transduction histidine kinase/CheY-like chemotaxis protein
VKTHGPALALLRSSWARAILWLLPPDVLRGPESLRQARLLLGICAITVVVEPLFALRHFYVTKNAGAAYVTFALAALAVLLPLLVRRGLSTVVVVQIAGAATVVAGLLVCLTRGGFLVTPLMGHVFLPLVGVLLDRRVVTLRWAAIAAVHLTLLALVTRLGLLGLAPASAAEYPQLLVFLVFATALAVAYDHMRRGIDRDRARLHADVAAGQRLESLGHLAAGVAHDFNNLLMVFRSAAAVMNDELPANHPLREDAAAVEEAVERGVAITARLMSFARHEQVTNGVFDVRDTVEALRTSLAATLPPTIQLRLDSEPERAVTTGEPRELERVLQNLVSNARDAMPGGGEIVIATRRELAPPDARGQRAWTVVISVTDDGAGIPSAILPHIFEPFFTTKPRSAATGLGLSTAWGIINAMGGDMSVASSPFGTRFELRLPEAGTEHGNALSTGDDPRATILLVEPKSSDLRSTKRLLERTGFRVLAASSGPAALALLGERGVRVDLLVTAVAMVPMSGVLLAAEIRARHLGVPVVYVSGRFDDPGVRRDVRGGTARLLPKPFTVDALTAVVVDILEGPLEVRASQPVPRCAPTTSVRMRRSYE